MFTSVELSNNRDGQVPFSQRMRLVGYLCLQLLAMFAALGFAAGVVYLLGENPVGSRGRLYIFLLAAFVAVVALILATRVVRVLIDVFWPSPAVRTGTLILRTSESVGQIFLGKRVWNRMVSRYYFTDADEWPSRRFYLLVMSTVLLEGLGVSWDKEFRVSQQFAHTLPSVLRGTVYYSRWAYRLLSVDRFD